MKFKQLAPQKKKSTKLLNKNDCPAYHWYAYDGDIVDGVVSNRVFFIRSWEGNAASVIILAGCGKGPPVVSVSRWSENADPNFTYTEVEVDLSNILVGVKN